MGPLTGNGMHVDLGGISEEGDSSYRRQVSQGGGESSVPVLNPVVFLKAQDLGLLLLFLHQVRGGREAEDGVHALSRRGKCAHRLELVVRQVTTIIARSPRLFDDMELRDFQVGLACIMAQSCGPCRLPDAPGGSCDVRCPYVPSYVDTHHLATHPCNHAFLFTKLLHALFRRVTGGPAGVGR